MPRADPHQKRTPQSARQETPATPAGEAPEAVRSGCVVAGCATFAAVLVIILVAVEILSSELRFGVDEPSHVRVPAVSPEGTFKAVSVGYAHACGLRTNGTIACWGRNSYGRAAPPAGAFTSVAVGDSFSCGSRVEGDTECWGAIANNGGTYVQISGGEVHACGRESSGRVNCWGRAALPKDIPRLFWGVDSWDTYDPVTSPPGGPFVNIDVGGAIGCGVLADGSLQCWPDEWTEWAGRGTVPTGHFASVSVGWGDACALRSDRTVVCWAWKIGLLDGLASPPGEFAAIDAGSNHACGLRMDGTIFCWGGNDVGQSAPPAGTFVSVSVGYGHACATRKDATVACWGMYPEGTEVH